MESENVGVWHVCQWYSKAEFNIVKVFYSKEKAKEYCVAISRVQNGNLFWDGD